MMLFAKPPLEAKTSTNPVNVAFGGDTLPSVEILLTIPPLK
jgi:hypothetical protein